VTAQVALDTSVAVALLVSQHSAHTRVIDWWIARGRPELSLAGPALAESYSVLTRLPGDLRVAPDDAARLLRQLGLPLVLSNETQQTLADQLSSAGIAGGAVYDAVVAVAALQHGLPLATRDLRARDTYERVGVQSVVVA
jgi:toxin FitB